MTATSDFFEDKIQTTEFEDPETARKAVVEVTVSLDEFGPVAMVAVNVPTQAGVPGSWTGAAMTPEELDQLAEAATKAARMIRAAG